MRNRLAAALAPLGLFLGACSTPPPPYASVMDFCQAEAQAMCQVSSACSVDEPACQMYQSAKCSTSAIQATTPGTRFYNPTGAPPCIDALDGAYGASNISFQQIQRMTVACERVFAGTTGLNGPCKLDYDCAGDLVCAPTAPDSAVYACAVGQSVGEGDSCAAPGTECPADTYCAQQTGGGWICTPSPGAPVTGKACTETAACPSTDHCENGTCQPRAVKGAACVTDDDCAASAPYCDPYASVCTLGLTFMPGGADCNGIAGPENPSQDPAGPSPAPVTDAGRREERGS